MPEHTIAENLSRLVTAKTDIANAITTMGGTVSSGDGFEEFRRILPRFRVEVIFI